MSSVNLSPPSSPPSSPPFSPLQSPLLQTPQATRFINAAGEVKKFYLRRNPWKWPFSDKPNDCQKLFLYCIVCGVKKYTDQEWARIPDATHNKAPNICEKALCATTQTLLSGFVPDTHYLVEKQTQDLSVRGKEFFEEVQPVTTFIRVNRLDKVFQKEEEMPQDYLPTFRRLESLPVEHRIPEIDLLYFANEENEHEASGRTSLTETSDPFKRQLALYRQKSVKVLDSMNAKPSS